jgi:hypothetical protein
MHKNTDLLPPLKIFKCTQTKQTNIDTKKFKTKDKMQGLCSLLYCQEIFEL